MTARGAIVLFLLGVVFTIAGAVLKLQHWPYGHELVLGASLMQTIAVIVLILKIVRYPGAKGFLDS
jgi:hypothetical protein